MSFRSASALCSVLLLATLFTCTKTDPDRELNLAPQQDRPAASATEADDWDVDRDFLAENQELYEKGLQALYEGEIDHAFFTFDQVLFNFLECQSHLKSHQELAYHFGEYVDTISKLEEDRFDFQTGMQTADPTALERLLDDALVDLELQQLESGLDESRQEEAFEMPLVHNKVVESFIKAFTGRRADVIAAGLERSTRYLPMIRRVFKEEGLPQELVYLPLIESAYKTHARSRARAVGLWQFMSSTGRLMGLNINWWEDQRRNPELATRAAARHLRDLYERYGDWNLALCAYNAGPGRVNRAIRRGNTRDFWEMARRRLLPRETIGYVPAFTAGVKIASNPEAYGFTNLNFQDPVPVESVDIDFPMDLKELAEFLGLEPALLEELNPALIRQMTPGWGDTVSVNVPFGYKDRMLASMSELPRTQRPQWIEHRIRRGDTLGRLAQRHGVKVRDLMIANKINNPRRLRIGQKIMIPLENAPPNQYAKAFQGSSDKPTSVNEGRTGINQHRIVRGDTLSRIARSYSTSLAAILSANPGIDPLALRPGQVIKVPSANFQPRQGHPGAYKTYTVVRGDSLSRIAQKIGTSVRALTSTNNISTRDTLYPGQKLKVPTQTNQTRVVTYTIRRGDTLSKIAAQYRTSIGKIVQWNNLSSKHRIRVGQKLVLYL